GQTRASVQPYPRPVPIGTALRNGLQSERLGSPNSASLRSERHDRPCGTVAYDRHAGPMLHNRGSGSPAAPRVPDETDSGPRRRDLPLPTPFGRERTTPIVQTRGG